MRLVGDSEKIIWWFWLVTTMKITVCRIFLCPLVWMNFFNFHKISLKLLALISSLSFYYFSEFWMFRFECVIRVFVCQPSIFLIFNPVSSHTSFLCFPSPLARSPRVYWIWIFPSLIRLWARPQRACSLKTQENIQLLNQEMMTTI